MKTLIAYIQKARIAVLLMSTCVLCACHVDSANMASPPEDGEYAVVDAVDASLETTRALSMNLDAFGISVYNVKRTRSLVENVQYISNGSGFTGTPVWTMVVTEMKAIGVSPSLNILDNVTLDTDNAYFDYTVPTTKQTMLKIGANLSFTKKSVNNYLYLKFVNALSLVTFRARNELKMDISGTEYDVTVYVKGITIHNLQAKGRFTYTSNTAGTWALSGDTYYNYSQDFENKVQLNTTTYVNVIDSVFTFLPQSPESNAWAPTGTDAAPETDAISYADADHKCYIELRCSMTIQRDNQTVYIYGDEDTFKPVYIPYVKKNCPKAWNAINRQSTYNIRLQKAEVLDSDGKPIKPEENENGGSFENAVFIEVAPTDDSDNDNVDDWEDMELDPYDVTI